MRYITEIPGQTDEQRTWNRQGYIGPAGAYQMGCATCGMGATNESGLKIPLLVVGAMVAIYFLLGKKR